MAQTSSQPTGGTGIAYVEVEPDDHVGSLRSKLEQAEGEQVLVFVPRNTALLRNPVTLRLVGRIAGALGRPVHFHIQDGATRTLARELGLPLVGRRNGRTGAFTTRQPRASERSRQPLIIGGALLVIFIAGSLLGASATVTLQQVTQMTSGTLIVTAVVGLTATSANDDRVPGRLIETDPIEANERTAASGVRKEPDARAKGSVAFVSRVDENVVVPQGTLVASATGLQFQTLAPATIQRPTGSRATTTAEALTQGTISNLPALSIDRLLDQNLGLKVAVLQEQAVSGGTDKEVKLVSNDDLNRLREQAQARLREQAGESVKRLQRQTESFYSDSVRLVTLSESFDRQVGDTAQDGSVGLRLLVRAQAIAFQGSQVNTIIQQRLEQGGQFKLVRDGLKTTPLEFSGRGEDWAAFRVGYTAELSPGLDERAARSAVAGRSPREAQAYFKERLELASEPKISISPPWLSTMPFIPARIDLRFARTEVRPS